MIIISALKALTATEVKRASSDMAFIGACIAHRAIEDAAVNPASALVKLAAIRKQLVDLHDVDAATGRMSCVLATHIYKLAGLQEALQMPSYHLIAEVAEHATNPAHINKVAGAVNMSLGRHYFDTVKSASLGMSALLPVLSGAAALTPDTLKLLAGLGIATGAAGGAALYKANEASSPDAADAEKLRRQAAVYRQMRHDIDQEIKTRGLLSVQQLQ